VAWVVSVVLVQPVASRQPTITTVAAMQRGIRSPAHSHVRVRVNSVLWCI
jgi:hypothetical protein